MQLKQKKYEHIFFDLDHTIWDFDKNAEETLHELFAEYELENLGLHSADIFIETYTRNNHQLWADYHLGKITKQQLRDERFKTTFTELGIHPDLIPLQFEDDYVRICPTKTNLFPHAHETLKYLQQRYELHLITNGFIEATQQKTTITNIAGYFKNIIISEVVGFNKPHQGIFAHAVSLANGNKTNSLMIGDSIEADIRGAQNFGMDAIYFNPTNANKPADVSVQITQLRELMHLL